MSDTIMNVKLKVGYTDDLVSRPSNIDQTSSGNNPYVSTVFKQLHKIISGLGNGAWVENTTLIYMGTLGTTGATITTLPSASASNKGYCYRVITNGAGPVDTSKVGDWYISDGTTWNLINFVDVDAVTQAVVTELTTGGTAVPEATHATNAEYANSAARATYAGSAVKAETADTLNVNGTAVGSGTQPVYFNSSGEPTPITYTIQSNVPSDAVFTDSSVSQIPKYNNLDYEVLFSGSSSGYAYTGYVGKNNTLKYNPSTGTLSAASFDGSIANAIGLTGTQVTTALGYTPGTSNFNGAFSSLSGKPTTISGYGITDASISNGVITLGSNTITPLTSSSAVIVKCVNEGSKNKLKFSTVMASSSNYGTSILTNGVRFTVNSDGSVTVNRESANSSAAYVYLALDSGAAITIDDFCTGEYVLSGCPSGGSSSTYRMYAAKSTYSAYDTGSGVLLPSTSITGIVLLIYIYSSYNPQNLVFSPMICKQEDWAISHNFAPYCSTLYDIYQFTGTTHNNLFRGKYLGNSYTNAQKSAVQLGTFDDLFVGDYWTINGINWRIADIDYYFNFGDTATTSHHLVIVPDDTLYDAKMNNTDTTAGGYSGSAMRTNNLSSAKTTINNAFGSTNILTYRDLLCNAVDTTGAGDVPATGLPTGWAWADCTVELMSEQQISGTTSWSTAQQNGYDTGTSYSQFALFRYNRQFINKTRKWFWLRNVQSASYFCIAGYSGRLSGYTASNSGGVRPLFLLS